MTSDLSSLTFDVWSLISECSHLTHHWPLISKCLSSKLFLNFEIWPLTFGFQQLTSDLWLLTLIPSVDNRKIIWPFFMRAFCPLQELICSSYRLSSEIGETGAKRPLGANRCLQKTIVFLEHFNYLIHKIGLFYERNSAMNPILPNLRHRRNIMKKTVSMNQKWKTCKQEYRMCNYV